MNVVLNINLNMDDQMILMIEVYYLYNDEYHLMMYVDIYELNLILLNDFQ
jgi:hypothetical protein